MDTELKPVQFISPEKDGLDKRICHEAGNEVAAYIYATIPEEELIAEPFFAEDVCWEPDSRITDARLFFDFRPANFNSGMNEYFCKVNKCMGATGLFIGCFESRYNLQEKIFLNYPKPIAWLIILFHFALRNILPVSKPRKRKIRKQTTSLRNSNTLAEVLGRLAYCGFEILGYAYFNNLTYFITRKKSEPRTETVSTSRFIVSLKRVGKGGKMISIFKVRSMYPYSEFIQDYVVKINGYDTMGKPGNDFRLTRIGKIIRRLFIDEIPQLYNLLIGDLRLVGVRPIGRYGYTALPQDLQVRRIRKRPGLLPPHIALRKRGIAGVIQAERQYLDERDRNPFRTDIKFCFLAVFNILFFRVKSS